MLFDGLCLLWGWRGYKVNISVLEGCVLYERDILYVGLRAKFTKLRVAEDDNYIASS